MKLLSMVYCFSVLYKIPASSVMYTLCVVMWLQCLLLLTKNPSLSKLSNRCEMRYLAIGL